MIQMHKIILWKKPDEEGKPFEEIAREAYEVMRVFQEYQTELRPNYLCAWRKRDAKEMEWDYENFKELLRKGVNKEGKRIFEDLGYIIEFFSSKNDDLATGFSLHVGCKNEKFVNTLIVSLPKKMDFHDEENSKIIRTLFERLVTIFKPFWGCVSNSVLIRKYGKYLDGTSPVLIHWLNYWSPEIVETVGFDRIQSVVDTNDEISFENGILSVGETVFDTENASSMQFHDEIQKQLLGF